MNLPLQSSVCLPDGERRKTEGPTRTKREVVELMIKVDIGLATRETLVVITARRKECQCQRVKVGDKKNYPGISKEPAQGWIWYTLNPSSCWKTIIFRNKLAKLENAQAGYARFEKVWAE